LAEPKNNEETFKVVDRRLFTPEGELRKEAVAEQERQERQESLKQDKAATKSASKITSPNEPAPAQREPKASGQPAPSAAEPVAANLPTPSRGFQVLVDFLAGNAAARLGMLPDARTGQAFLDLEGANELIDMLDALSEKTRGNLTHEEEQLLIEVLRSLKLSYLEMTKAAAKAMAEQAKGKA
jgi:Domain of unknown function (DUF1844)